MKKCILSLALLLLLLQAFCQEPATTSTLTKESYLRKSKASKITGWILFGAGVGMLAGSVATYKLSFDIGPVFGIPTTPSHVDNTTSTLLGIGGACSLIGSIISFSAAGRNKRQAAALSLTNQRIPVLQQNVLRSTIQPTVPLRIPL